MPNPRSLADLLQTIAGHHKGGKFPAFIDWLRLHSFKNIADATQISFGFPITALVGPNGSGKSSVLQALFGCPEGYSIGQYWFSTELDPIAESADGSRAAIIYSYHGSTGDELQVIKTRIKWNKEQGTSKNPDYWETSRPIQKLGMTPLPDGKRHPAIKKEVYDLNFRYQLSAFDRYFYLEEVESYHKQKGHSRQDVIRKRSPQIAKALGGAHYANAKKVVSLSDVQCQTISRILGKSYRSGKILQHRFHGFWAPTVVFETESKVNPLTYTEANAGSGEVAVALLVHKISQGKAGSLILLDEPEYSLHPAAQREVLRYLAEQCLEKKLQIVFTTHSPAMIEGLPKSAIKVFEPDATSDKFIVHQDRGAEEAFLSLGHLPSTKTTIRVEDALAKELVQEVISRMMKRGSLPAGFDQLVDVRFYPGGANVMRQDAVLYSREKSQKIFLLFDGDQKRPATLDPSKLTQAERSPAGLTAKLKEWLNQDINFHRDGGSTGGRADQFVLAVEDYVAFHRSSVGYLPFDTPEAAIWSDKLAKDELAQVLEPSDAKTAEGSLQALDPKQRFDHLARLLSNHTNSDRILALQTKFLKHWLKSKDPQVAQLEGLLQSIRSCITAA
jgi:predicted ATPase